MFGTELVQDCGHDVADDDALVKADPMAPAAGQDAPAPGPQCTVLAWDERMTLHAEGRHNPHPERPDRLRAVMARLLDSGLAGAPLHLTPAGVCGALQSFPSASSSQQSFRFRPQMVLHSRSLLNGLRISACCLAQCTSS